MKFYDAIMKCPVCEEKYNFPVRSCYECGFNRMRTEFVNNEDMRLWFEETVEPCRVIYEEAKEQYSRLNKQYSDIKNKYDKLKIEYEKILNMHANQTDIMLMEKDMCNGDDRIDHPDNAECTWRMVDGYVTCRITNIKSNMNSDKRAAISFTVEKIKDSKGADSTEDVIIRYKIKNSDDIIVLNDIIIISGLKIGDRTMEAIELNDFLLPFGTKDRYSVDFTDF